LTKDTIKRPRSVKSAPFGRMFGHIDGLHTSILTDKVKIAANISGLALYYKGKVETARQRQWVLTLLALAGGDPGLLFRSGMSINSGGEKEPWLGASNRWISSNSSPRLLRQLHVGKVSPTK
jgi:hypothetical protein